MSSSEANGSSPLHSVFTAPQIMTLQAQVKAFKELSTRYTELETVAKNILQSQLSTNDKSSNGTKTSPLSSKPPPLPTPASSIPSHQHQAPKSNPPSAPAPIKPSPAPPIPSQQIPPPVTSTSVVTKPTVHSTPAPSVPSIPTPQPSWQCFGSLLFCAPTSIPNIDLKKDSLETISVSYQVNIFGIK